jgi:L-ascorbate metabolism protein UlaG (beta-lactamase superfamily)
LLSTPGYVGPTSDHFDGRRFHNSREDARGFLDFLRWMATRKAGPWRDWTEAPRFLPPPERVDDLRVTFVNHATVLVQTGGVNVLTDPVWSERVSPVSFAGPRRHKPAGVAFDGLPPIDLVAVSHNHYDHLDVATLRRLARRDGPALVTGLGNRALLERNGIGRAVELDWWQTVKISDRLTVTGVPVQHFSGRGLGDRNRTLWSGFVFSTAAGDVFFAGDTGYSDVFCRIRERFPAIRLALIPIGAYRPEWFMGPVHVAPAQALQIHRDLGAQTGLGIHFGTFRLTDEGQDEPAEEIQRLLAASPEVKPRFWVLENGEGRDVP